MDNLDNLSTGHCTPCEGGQPPLLAEEIKQYLQRTPEWQVNKANTAISRHFKFKGFQKTMFFINAISWISNQEGHHPVIEMGYDYCTVSYSTHAINGLSKNDFVCAAKVDALFL